MQDLVLQTFSLLSHTPIIACGINPSVHYAVGSVDYWHKIGHTLAPKDLVWGEMLEQPEMQSLTIKSPRRGEFPGEINVTVEPSTKFSPGILVTTNYHYALPLETIHAGAADQAMKFVRTEWNDACSMARKVAEHIFTKIEPDNA